MAKLSFKLQIINRNSKEQKEHHQDYHDVIMLCGAMLKNHKGPFLESAFDIYSQHKKRGEKNSTFMCPYSS